MDNHNIDRTDSRTDPAEPVSAFLHKEPRHYVGVPARQHSRSDSDEVNMNFILRAMLRHVKVLLLFGVIGLITGIVYIQVAQPVYKAESILEMNVRRPRVINNDAVYEDTGPIFDTDTIFNTRFEKFKSPAMEKMATQEFFKRYPDATSDRNPVDINRDTLPILMRDVKWSKDPDANIVRVSYEYPYPLFAANLVNVLSDCAGDLMMDENRALSDEAVKWLITQVEEQRVSLEEIEEKLSALRKEVHLDALEQRKAAMGLALGSVSEEREMLLSTLTERQTVHDFLSGLKDIDPKVETLPAGLPKEAQLNDLLQGWRTAHDEFQQLAGRYTSVHPEYRLAEEKESRALQRLKQFIELSAKTVKNEIGLIERQIEQMDQRIDSMKRESLDLEQRLATGNQRVQQLERKRDAADNSYQTMLRRMEEARASADDNMAFTKVIRYAEVPKVPVKPKKPVVIILSVALAGGIAMGLVVFLEFWKDSVGSISELRKLNLNVLGLIPSQKKPCTRSELATIGLRDRFNPIVEIFAGINALLSSERYSSRSKVLLMCSVMPEEGKTMTSCNMAISSALNGTRTLLIEGDLRRPQLCNIFSIDESHPSLLEWLMNGNSELRHEDLLYKEVTENLDIISSRPLSDTNPSDVIGRGRLAELLAWARGEYDRIIIDSPPLGPVGDAQVLANISDGIFIVSRIGKTRRRLLRFALNRLAEIDAPVIGCIANDVPNTLIGMFEGADGYGYGFGYGYKPYKHE